MQKALTESIDFSKYQSFSEKDIRAEIRSASLSRENRVLHLDMCLNYQMTPEEIEIFRVKLLKKLPGIRSLDVMIEAKDPLNAAEIAKIREKAQASKAAAETGANPHCCYAARRILLYRQLRLRVRL